NLTVGGTGKTPAALWLAERLTARGRRVGIVARGYRKRRPGPVVVGVEGRALVTPAEGGDEAVTPARRFPGPGAPGTAPARGGRALRARHDRPRRWLPAPSPRARRGPRARRRRRGCRPLPARGLPA